MSTVNALKKEVILISKALKLKGAVPDWKKRSEEIQLLLKEYEQLSQTEKQKQTKETVEYYKENGSNSF